MRKRLIISIILLVISVISLAAALIMWNAAHAPVSGYATSQGNISLTVLESAVGENGWSEIIPPEGVFEPYNASLSGTHVSTFSVRFVGLNLSSSNMLRCDIRKANGHILQISRTGVNARYENFSLNYTVQASDSIINDAEVGYIPWILKNCSIVNISGSVLFNETHKGRIYTHDDSYWTDDEVTRAVTCEGTPGVYFDNSASCEFSEDTLFALQMRNGNPVEVSCFNNHGVNCSNDYCKGIYFPTCDPLSYFLGYSADTDDPNGYTTFTASFAGYNTPVAYTRYTNTSGGSFKLRVTQALTSKTFSFTIYNLTYVDAAKTSVYGYNTGAGTLTATQQVDGTWSVAYYRFTAFTGTLDFAFNVSFTGGIGNDNRTLKLVIAYGTDTNQGAPSYFDALFNTTNGLYNSNENQTTALTTDGSVCGDGVNNDFDYISAGGAWTYSYDCFDRDCNGSAGSSSQTNEFGAGKTGYCNYGRELNCTDEFDNDYDYANSSDYTDCHDANCFHIDAACPAVELICNDGINNDWDYTNTESDAANKVGNNGTKYTSGYTSNLIDCEDGDCNNQIGGPLGQICTWGYERNCSDAFDNDELQLKDCELTSVAGATAMPSVANAEYDCSGYCRATNASIETGDACRDNIDNDWDAVIVNGLYTGTANNTWGAGIDCRWTSYNPDEECNLTMMNVSGSMKRCELAREITCNDGFDNDYDTNAPAAMRPSPNWTANAYLYTFNLSLAANSDFEDYDCQGDAEVPASESSNASWCFDGIDNDMDRYYWNGSAGAWEIDNSGGIDCVDSDCLGAIDPDTSRTCLLYEYNSSDSFFMLLANPGMFCSNSLDDDADNGWGWPTGGTDCRDPDCNKQFGMCAGPCYETENVSWNSCANGLDDDYDMPTAYPDCEDSTCLGMVGDSTGATCESAETQCDDGLDNDADSQTDCSDSSCSNRAGGKINDIQVYCRASEATNGDCSDGFDNDADGYADCYDAGCNTPCNLSTISGTSPITLPVWLGVTSINSVTDAYILAYTKQIKNGYEYNITFRKTGASTNAQWTLGTAARQFNKTKFNTASAHLAGANADNFTITETANGFRLDSNHANLPSGYTFSFLVTSITPFASSTYELTYAEEYGAKTSLNNYFYHEVDENVTPTAQSIKISPQNGKIDYGASVYLRANISDNSGLGVCRWRVYGSAAFSPSDSTQCRATFSPSVEGAYYVNVTPIDYYSNTGSNITQAYNLDIMPTPISTTLNKAIPFYNATSSETIEINASFNMVGSDSLGTCTIIASNESGYETTLGTYAAAGNICYASGIGISTLRDGKYEIFAKVQETTEGDTIESARKVFFVCRTANGAYCKFADYNMDGKPDLCPPASGLAVTLVSPANNFISSSSTNDFECTAFSSVSPLRNMTLYIWNSSGEIYYSNTQSLSGMFNDTLWNVNVGSDGNYSWNCLAHNYANGFGWGEMNWTFSLVTEPRIYLVSPEDHYSSTKLTYELKFNVSGTSNIDNCTLDIESNPVQTIFNVTPDITHTLNYTFAGPGKYRWKVRCYDSNGRLGNSETRDITVESTGGGGTVTEIVSGAGGGSTGMGGGLVDVSPDEFDLDVIIDEETSESIRIRNVAGYKLTLDFYVIGLDEMIDIPKRVTLDVGEEKIIDFSVLVEEKGTFTGKILIVSSETNDIAKEIPITLDVSSRDFLFDMIMKVLNKDSRVARGKYLEAQISLTEIAARRNVEVNLTFTIKDMNNREYLRTSEMFNVLEKADIIRVFGTSRLKFGRYVLGVQAEYPEAFANTSVPFEVVPGIEWGIVIGAIVIFALMLAVIIYLAKRGILHLAYKAITLRLRNRKFY